MVGITVRREALIKGFELVYFIHPQKDLAIRVATEAMNKLEVAVAAQDKRLYYTPKGRGPADRARTEKFRNKVSMGELQLLQRLIYIESEPHERNQEQAGQGAAIKEEDMVIRFIKHLVRAAIKRNSFYITLGISRLLHNYSTSETTDIYDVVIQDPDRVKDDYYFRKVKRQLMQELADRFGDLVKIVRVQRGEERFHSQEGSGRWVGLVRECLNHFTPWNSACVFPLGSDVNKVDIPALTFAGGDPDREHPVEINRIHSVVHPDCFSRLIAGLKFDCPEKRLEIPQFFLSNDADEGGHGGERRRPPNLPDEEIAAIQNVLADQAARRRTAVPGLLSIVVDGTERARLDLYKANRARFEVEEGAELIEVRSREKGETLLLAAHLLTQGEMKGGRRTQMSSIVLEGGQKISFAVSLQRDSDAEAGGAVVQVAYGETRLIRATSILLHRAKNRAVEFITVRPWASSPVLKPVLALAFVAVLGISLTVFIRSKKSSDKQPEIAEQRQAAPTTEHAGQQTPPTVPAPTPPSQSIAGSKPQTGDRVPATGVQKSHRSSAPEIAAKRAVPEPHIVVHPSPETEASEIEATRKPNTGSVGVTLPQVRRIHVESLGDDLLSVQARATLVNSLRANDRFTIIDISDEADAVLKGFVRVRKGEATVSLRLVNSAGTVLWAYTQKGVGTAGPLIAGPVALGLRLRVDLSDLTSMAVEDLNNKIEGQERKPRPR